MLRLSHPSEIGSRIACLWFESQVLKNNPLGDPHRRALYVYLPPGYEDGIHAYSTIYFLPAFMASGVMELNENPFDESLQARLDRLIQAGKIPPLLFVLPDPMTRYGGSQYVNSIGQGRYSDYVLELMEVVDTHFRTVRSRDHRVLMGKSSGGYGALMHAMRYPQHFGLVVDHSGDKDFERCYAPLLPRFVTLAQQYSLAEVLQDPAAYLRRGMYVVDLFFLLSLPAMSAAYSPNPQHALGFDLPVDLKTGKEVEQVWHRWRVHDPLLQLERYADALRSLRLLYFDAGVRDEFKLHEGSERLSEALTALCIPHRWELFEGGHSRTQYRYDVSLVAVAEALPSTPVPHLNHL